MEERGVQGLVHGGVETLVGGAGVGEDHVGVLAAELQGDLLHGRCGGPGHLRTAGETAGEGDEVDVGVLGEPGAHRVARAGDEVGRAVGKSGLGEQPDQVDGGERGDLAGLEHEGVAGGEGRGDLPAGLEEGVVPGGDQGADADGLVDDDAVDVGVARVDDPAAALVHHEVGEVAEGSCDVVDVDPALFEGLAGVAALGDRDLLAVTLEQLGDLAQQPGTLGDGLVRPGAVVEGASRRRDRRIGVLGPALRDDGQDRGVGGVDDLARRA